MWRNCSFRKERKSKFENFDDGFRAKMSCDFRKALYILKKKRFCEQLIERTMHELDNIERMVSFYVSGLWAPVWRSRLLRSSEDRVHSG